jgi:hypothetical protein
MITPRGMSNARETTMVAIMMLIRSPWFGLGPALSQSRGTEESKRVSRYGTRVSGVFAGYRLEVVAESTEHT